MFIMKDIEDITITHFIKELIISDHYKEIKDFKHTL